MAASRKVIDDIVARDAVVYGVNTGFGKLADVRIPHERNRSAPTESRSKSRLRNRQSALRNPKCAR